MSLEESDRGRLSRPAYDRLLDAADTYREALVVGLCGDVGLRPAEIAELTPASIERIDDPPGHLLAVGTPDGDRSRTAYLPARLERELRRYVRSNGIGDDDRIFDVTPRRLQMLVSDVADRASERFDDPALGTVSTGDLRRFFARTALVEDEINPRVVKAVGGWHSFEALEPYLPAPTDDEIVDAFTRVDEGGGDDDLVTALLAATDRCAVVRLDEDGYVDRWNRSAAAVFDYRASEIVGTHLSAFYADDVERNVPERRLSAATTESGIELEGWRVRSDGSRFRAAEIIAPLDEGGDPGGFAVFVADVTPFYERLEAAGTARLEPESAILECSLAVTEAILDASTHGELEREACEALTEGELYTAAWIDRTVFSGHADARSGEWRTAVGITADEIERLELPAAAPPTEPLSIEESVTGDVGGDRFDGALATVPIRYGDTVYGTLAVMSARPAGFTDSGRASLETLGRQLGHAVAAIRRRNLLLSDTLVELEFRIRDDRSFFVDASRRLDCRFELDSLVPLSESTQLYYLHFAGASPADVFDLAETDPGIGDCRLIETYEDGWRIEFVVEGSSPTLTLTEYGVTVTETVVDEGVATITVECAADADIRTIVGGLRSAFPTSELVGKREVERSVQTAREFREGLEERLTDRQEATLRAAYFGGYYDWPRESTAEELADAMGISSPTLHNHLRKGQHELLRTFFDADTVESVPQQ